MLTNRQLFLRFLGQTSSSPMMLEIVRAEGVFLFGPSGEKYLDLISGVSVSNTGHHHPTVVKAVKDQADAYMHLMVYGEIIQSPQVGYAQYLSQFLPPSLQCTYFVNSGSEAVEGAGGMLAGEGALAGLMAVASKTGVGLSAINAFGLLLRLLDGLD